MTTTEQEKNNDQKRKYVLIGITLLFIITAVIYAIYYVVVLSKQVQTDNAYVGGNLITLSSQIEGNVQEIRADETQRVTVGTEVIKLDPVDAELALSQASAKLAGAVRQQRERYADATQFDAIIEQKELVLKNAEADLARRAPLAADHTVSGEDIAHAQQAVANAKAALKVTGKQADANHAAIVGVRLAQHPNVLAARTAFIQAWLSVRRTAIVAPASGYVAKRSVQVGSHITPGMALMSVVPLDQLWVDANFKESELQNIRVGQTATIEADMYGSKVEFHGKVLGLSAGTGSAFSLLPAQNASGNWIKVVQRVPVRITLDAAELAQHPLRIGLSTTVTIDTHKTDGPMLGAPMSTNAMYSTNALTQPVKEAEAAADTVIAQNMANIAAK